MDQELPADFTLRVGDSIYLGRESMVPFPIEGVNAYWWPSAPPDWLGDGPVEVALILHPGVPLGDRQKAPVTGYFSKFPSEHDGSGDVSFRIYFSEGVATTADALRDHVLSVTGGAVSSVKPVGSEGTIWAFSVTPESREPVTIQIEADLDCALPDAVCTADGRRLFNRLELTVEAKEYNAPAGAPTISGTVEVGETIMADTSGISDADGLTGAMFSYQWVSNDGSTDNDIQDATASTYTLVAADEGKTIKVRVSFTDDANNEGTLTSAATVAVAAASPSNSPATGAPTISGTAQVGETLTADTTGISDADGLDNADFDYQWLAGDAAIAGAASSTYTLVAADEGRAIRVRVSFTDDGGHSESLTSGPTGVTAAALRLNSATVDGAALVLIYNETLDEGVSLPLTAFTLTANGIARSLSQVAISGSAVTLTLTSAMAGGETVTISYARPDGPDFIRDTLGNVAGSFSGQAVTNSTPEEESSAGKSEQPAANTPASGDPKIRGTAREGETLTVDTSGISDEDGMENASFTYQWTAGSDHIDGATSAAHTLTRDEAGLSVRVRVSFTDDAGNPEAVTSAATGPVAPAPANKTATGAPVISGTARVGETLTAATSGIADDDGLDKVSYDYQWIAGNTDISGATGATYTLIEADEGKAIKVRVSFTDDASNEESLTSAATDAVDAAAQPLSASLKNTPDSHDGGNVFTFELRFSEEFNLSYVTLQDHAFTVAGGSVEKAHRVEKPSNIRWRITVRPDGDGDVTITLPVTKDCAADGAICTEDGRMLSNRLELTVSGPE